jgi:glyoxylase-like metal-dependent hydrolase (beta-lactamase superfamily II)
MKRLFGAIAAIAVVGAASAQTPQEVTLTRIDCGTGAKPTDIGRFSDIYAYEGQARTFTFSCYLIKHGNEHLVWDTGFAPGSNPNAPKVGIVERLAELKVKPEQVKYVGISHYHGDHTGQLAPFTAATLLIGKGDWDAVTAPTPAQGVNAAAFVHWTKGGGKVEPLTLDKDVFGDGTVVILRTPGHTPGHSALLVRLKEKGAVLLSGDLVHFRENYESNGVPSFNADRAQTIASLERFKKIAAALNAMVVIQHDTRDIDKLPAWPNAAK